MTENREERETQPASITDLQPKMRLQGVVKEVQLYGALVDIGLEYNGLVHISQLAPRRVNRVNDVVQTGDNVTVWVTEVDPEKGRIGLTMVEPPQLDWQELAEGQIHTGTVTRIEPYGAFIEIGAERPGLLHVREMATGYVRNPSEVVKMGEQVDVRVLQLDRQRRRIDLTMIGVVDEIEDDEPAEELVTMMEIALQRAQGDVQTQEQTQRRRRGKRRRLDFSERENILASTLKKHSQH